MEATLQAWKAFSSQEFIDQVMKPMQLTTSSLSLLIPDIHITHWMNKDIKVLADLMVGPTLKTFEALQIEYGLEDNDQYRYIQIAHLLHKTPQITIDIPWRVFLYLTNPRTNIKGISLFYNLLNNKNIVTKANNIKAWEQDLGATYTEEQWQTALPNTFNATKSANLWEIFHKLLLRWYLTPY